MTMTLTTVEVPVEKAKEQLRAYRTTLREARRSEQRAEDRILSRAFYYASRGHQIIDINATVRAGGVDEKGRPRLAIAPATATRVLLHLSDSSVWFCDDALTGRNWPWYDGRVRVSVGDAYVRVDDWPAAERVATVATPVYRGPTAIIPSVPPAHRPRPRRLGALVASDPIRAARLRQRTSLTGHHILFEAEWSNVAPRDPALLRHIGGPLFRVLAVWDLTELERTVLGYTRSGR